MSYECPKNWRFNRAPRDGEPSTRKVNGKTIHYCKKCGRGKGRWSDTHEEKDHRNGWMEDKKNDSAKTTDTTEQQKSTSAPPAAEVAEIELDQDVHSSVSSWFDDV